MQPINTLCYRFQEQEQREVEVTEDEDLLEEYLQRMNEENTESSQSSEVSGIVAGLLYEFKLEPRLNLKSCLLTYWEKKKFECPELYKLAMIVQSVPMTQVSVERLFNSIKYIF